MTSGWSRRDALLLTGSALTVGLAGCSAIGPFGESSGTPTPSPVPTPLNPDVIEASASIINAATENHPAEVRLRVENVSEDVIAVSPGRRGGRALEFVEKLEPTGDQPGLVVFHPGRPEVILQNAEVPNERVNGCWRFPQEAMRATIDMRKWDAVLPGESYKVDHEIYYEGPDSVCFPEGDYTASISVIPGPTPVPESRDIVEPRVSFEYTFTVSSDKDFSISTRRTETE